MTFSFQTPPPSLSRERLNQMIACATSFPQERPSGLIHRIFQSFSPISFFNGFRAEIAVACMLVLVCVSLVNTPNPFSVSMYDTDSAVSELHDLMVYDTVEESI